MPTLPSLSQKLDDFYAAAWQVRRKGVVDNVFGQTAGWNLLVKQKKAADPQRGGRFIEITLRYAKNETIRFIGRGATMPIVDTASLAVAYFNWKYMAGSIARYFTDDQQTTGKTQILSMAKEKINVLQLSLVEYAEAALFGDGTGDGGLALDGLQKLISITPTVSATIGGYDQNTYPWWRNKHSAFSGSFDIFGIPDMRTMRNDCSNGGLDFPDICITTQAVMEAYEDEGLEYYQFSDRRVVDLGFDALKYKGTVIVWATSCPTGLMYFINSKYLRVVYDPMYNFVATPWKDIPNQPNDRVMQVVWVGNTTISNRKKQGVLSAFSA